MSFEPRRMPCAFMLFVYHHQRYADSFFLACEPIYLRQAHSYRSGCQPYDIVSACAFPFDFPASPDTVFYSYGTCGTTAHFTILSGRFSAGTDKMPEAHKGPFEESVCAASGDYYFDILSVVGKCFKSFVEGIKL